MLKYVIFDDNGIDSLVIFDAIRDHSDIVERINLPVKSAGEISFSNDINDLTCVNGSVTLHEKFDINQSNQDEKDIMRLMSI